MNTTPEHHPHRPPGPQGTSERHGCSLHADLCRNPAAGGDRA